MGINKGYKVAILLNGREIIFEEGFENEESRQGPIWKNPMNISIMQTRDGKGQIAIVPTCTFGKNKYIEPVGKEAIVTIYNLDANLNASYEDVVQKLNAQKAGIEIIPAGAVPKVKDISKHPATRNGRRVRR